MYCYFNKKYKAKVGTKRKRPKLDTYNKQITTFLEEARKKYKNLRFKSNLLRNDSLRMMRKDPVFRLLNQP